MATALDVSVRKPGLEYHQEAIPQLGGLDADANDSTIAKERFRELHNLRLSISDDIEVRTGYKEFQLRFSSGTPPSAVDGLPVAKSEYNITLTNGGTNRVYRFDVTAVWGAGVLVLMVLDKRSETMLAPVTIGSYASEPIVATTEYQNSMVVTVFGDAVYEVFPGNLLISRNPDVLRTDPTTWTWTVQKIGKQQSSLPDTVDFAQTTTGAWYPYLALKPKTGNGDEFLPNRLVTTPGEKEPQYATFDIGIKYFRADNPGFIRGNASGLATAVLQKWAFALDTEPSGEDKRLKTHAQSRAWTYRVVNVYDIVDAKGNKRTVYGKPSADMPVPDIYYAPAQITDTYDVLGPDANGADTVDGTGSSTLTGGWMDDAGMQTAYQGNILTDRDTPNTHTDLAVPSYQDFYDLSHLVSQYLSPLDDRNTQHDTSLWFGDTELNGGDIGSPFFFAALYLGWRINANQFSGAFAHPGFSQHKPYRNNVLASDLKRAPLTVFNWNDFPQARANDLTLTEIRIYRSAHSEPGDKDNLSKDPLFEKYKHGYVGSVKPGATFTDDISDNEAMGGDDFAEDYEGYLQGDFSGQVIRAYNQKLVVLNTKTTYRMRQPWLSTRAFADSGRNEVWLGTMNDWLSGLDPAAYYNSTPSHPTAKRLWMSYVDRDGNESAATPISVDTSTAQSLSLSGTIVVQMPRGYEEAVSSVKLYYGEWDGLSGQFKYSLVVPISAGTTPFGGFSPSVEAIDISKYTLASVTGLPAGNPVDAYEPGEAIYSEIGNMYHVPPLNAELFDQHSGVTGAEVVMGRLWVLCENSTHLTTLSADGAPELEEETKWTGCASRFTQVKFGGLVFFLSANGVYYAQGSGVRPFPAHVISLVRPYLTERIPGSDLLANARRASMGIIASRFELWLHIPSSRDLWIAAGKDGSQALPHLTVCFKFPQAKDFWNRITESENYTFDWIKDFELGDLPGQINDVTGVRTPAQLDPATYHTERVIFSSQSDGTLWSAAHVTGASARTITVDCDRDEIVPSFRWRFEKPLSLGLVTTPKQMRMVAMKAIMDADVNILTGLRRMDGGYDLINGNLDPQCTAWPLLVERPLKPDGYAHTPPGNAFESLSLCPYIRVIGQPTSPSSAPASNTFQLQGVEVYLSLKHHHPS